jgi:hypothetical protein
MSSSHDDLAQQYARGIAAAYSKMVARVGKDEAEKWKRNAIAAAPMYGRQYAAIRDHAARKATRGTEAS